MKIGISKIDIRPGVFLWRGLLSPDEQALLLADVMARIAQAPFYRAAMPRTGKLLSVEMSNFGSLGWFTDQARGYRYETHHPVTGKPWPDMPKKLLALWDDLTGYRAPPEACLVNLYRGAARMGLHQDRNEPALDAPVLSVSLGDEALFRMGGPEPKGATVSFPLVSGDVLVMGGPSRLSRHGVDRVRGGSSTLVPGGGRINLTLRRVNAP